MEVYFDLLNNFRQAIYIYIYIYIYIFMNICIHIYEEKLVTIVKGDAMAPIQ